MERIVRAIYPAELERSLELVEKVFTDSECEENGKLVRALAAEIRSKQYYVPALDIVAVDEKGEIIGLAIFSRFHIEGKYEDELLLLSPVAVKTELQRQHISKDMIEYGLKRARELGYTACIVEGNPLNYRPRGFVTSAKYGVIASESVGLPHEDCLMIQELAPGALEHIKGAVDYRFYDALR